MDRVGLIAIACRARFFPPTAKVDPDDEQGWGTSDKQGHKGDNGINRERHFSSQFVCPAIQATCRSDGLRRVSDVVVPGTSISKDHGGLHILYPVYQLQKFPRRNDEFGVVPHKARGQEQDWIPTCCQEDEKGQRQPF